VKAQMPAASLWGASPYYLGSTPNPKTALGLLTAIDDALALHLNLGELNTVADEFTKQVSLAVRENSEIQEQIRMLEQRYDERGEAQQQQGTPEFPPTGAIIADLENFLRKQRDEGE
jgi:proteasome assembly chaperone (PAC2) family protein